MKNEFGFRTYLNDGGLSSRLLILSLEFLSRNGWNERGAHKRNRWMKNIGEKGNL
jgi:hypothetical protein